jgi:hypothetical protein
MKDLYAGLRDNFTIVNLGCIGDPDLPLPAEFRRTLTVIEADVEGGAATGDLYHRKIVIPKPIAGRAGKRTFRRNNFPGTCSLLEPLDGVVEAFGMENYCRLIERIEFDCETIPDLLRANRIKSLDFLKTDIEGLDHEIVASCREFFGQIQFIQCELRFRPFYQGEPYFHETVNLLVEHGYEVLDLLHIDRWQYKTPRRRFQVQGRAQWADFLFVLRPEKIAENFGEQTDLAVAKQVILSCMLGKKNYGEFLLHKFRDTLPAPWYDALNPLTRPAFPGFGRLVGSVRSVLRPLELFLKHQIGKSEFAAIK